MLEEVIAFIDKNLESALTDLKKLVRVPSVAAKGEHLNEAAELVASMLETSGMTVELHSPEEVPIVTGELNVGAEKTLLIYDHFDVQPAEPLELWNTPPFEPAIRDGRIYGRGVADNKGDLVSRIWAIRAFQETGITPPVNVRFIIEGGEEISSPNLPEFVKNHRDFLQADGGIWEFGGAGIDGRQEAWLGLKGIVYVQLEVQMLNHDAHSGNACVLPSAAYRLVWALNSLKDQNENILIDGFYDGIKPFTDAEREAIAKINLHEDQVKNFYGINSFLKGLSGDELKEAFYGSPTCNICGLKSGWQGPGSMTVLPAKASAKIDFRLVEGQDDKRIIQLLRKHLDNLGFTDVKIAWTESYPAAKTPLEHPFVKVVSNATKRVFGHEPVIHPTSPGSGPLYLFKDLVPMVSVGCGDFSSQVHSPNESIRIDNFHKSIKRIVVIMDELSKIR